MRSNYSVETSVLSVVPPGNSFQVRYESRLSWYLGSARLRHDRMVEVEFCGDTHGRATGALLQRAQCDILEQRPHWWRWIALRLAGTALTNSKPASADWLLMQFKEAFYA